MHRRSSISLVIAVAMLLSPAAWAQLSGDLEGLHKADSTNFNASSPWTGVNLQDWKELDYIPCRIALIGGPATDQPVSVTFPHFMNGIPGFQNLYFLSNSANMSFTQTPTLLSPAGADDWSYRMRISVTDNQPVYIYFRARLAAGAHLNVGSSLHLDGEPSLSPLQIHKPGPGPGSPDLAITKSGPAGAAPGEVITYTITYTNAATGTDNTGTGVQLTDVLPGLVTYVAGSASGGGTIAGDTLSWDITDLVSGASGAVTYQVTVSSNALFAQTFTNNALILSAEDDANLLDNRSRVITTINVNRAPTATPDSYTVPEDGVLTVNAPGVLGNDSDPENAPINAILVTTTTNGALSFNTNGSFTYTPNADYNGGDSFTYKANDGTNDSVVVTVTISVTPVNDAPVAIDDSYSVNEDTVLTIAAPGVLANDTDVDLNPLTSVLLSNALHGVVSLNADGSFTYTPATNFVGTDVFMYRANDGAAFSDAAIVTINVTPVNDRPVANDDSYATGEDTTLTIPLAGVLANDTDADGDSLTAVIESNPSHGAVTLNADGSFTYVPNTNYNGSDSFTYRASDGQTSSAPATVSITVNAGNDAPIARDDSYAVDEDAVLTVGAAGVLANDSDIDGDTLSAVLVSGPAHGAVSLNADGSFTYTPNTNFNGSDSFTYKANDGLADSGIATVSLTVRPVNDPPTGNDDGGDEGYRVLEDATLTIAAPGVLANDTDIDNDPLTAALVTNPAHGSVTLNSDGSFTYTPAADYFGNDSFTYVVNDGTTNSAAATVRIVVAPVNDAPTFVAGANQRVNYNVAAQSVPNWASGISAGPANESNQVVHFNVSNDNTALFSAQPSISADGTLSYTPVGTIFGVATVTVTLQDDGGTSDGGVDTSAVKTFTITLNGPPTVSIVNPANGAVFIGTNHFTVIANATDPDSVVTNVQIFQGTNLIGNFTNAPYFVLLTNVPPSTNPYTFSAIAIDDLGLSATSAIASITVTQSPPVSTVGSIALNAQTGLFDHILRITNPSPENFLNGVRVFVRNVTNPNAVRNATGTNSSGVPYIDFHSPLLSGATLQVTNKYFFQTGSQQPTPLVSVEPLPYTAPSLPAPRVTLGADAQTLRFNTLSNHVYFIQTSTDLVHWTTRPGAVTGTGSPAQVGNAAGEAMRFYRVLLLP